MAKRSNWLSVVLVCVLLAGCASRPSEVQTSRVGAKSLLAPATAKGFHFMILSDRTGGDITEGTQVYRQAIEQTNRMRPDFVCTVGDLVWGYGDRQGWIQEANDLKADLQQLRMPFFPVAGNHEIYWHRDTENRPKTHHESDYETHFGPLWYAFEYQNCWFVSLFSDEGDLETGEKGFQPDFQRISDEQFAWLKGVLEKAKGADHVFLFLHHPRWVGKGYGDVWDKVHNVLVEAGNVSAVFTGHFHRNDYSKKDGIDYYVLGTTGGNSPFPTHHFYWISVQAGDYQISEIPVDQPADARLITTKREAILPSQKWDIQSPENRTLEWELSTKGWHFKEGVIDCIIDYPRDESDDQGVRIRYLDENRQVLEDDMIQHKGRWSSVIPAVPGKTYYFQIIDEDVSFDNESSGNQGMIEGYLITREIREK